MAILISLTFLLTDVMAGVYAGETIKSLNKLQIIDLFLKNQEHATNTITSFANEIKELNLSLRRLESDVTVSKK